MNKQIGIPKGIKIIAGLMFVFGLVNLGMNLTEGISWTTEPTGKTTFSISLKNFQLPGKFANRIPVKTWDETRWFRFQGNPWHERIIGEVTDKTGKIISPINLAEPEHITSTIHWYTQNIASLFLAILFVIAGVGLWKIKNWGLLLALIALTARISLEVVLTPLFLIWVNEAVGTPPFYYENWIQVMTDGGNGMNAAITAFCWRLTPVIFAVIGILYLWRKRIHFV